MGSIRGSGRSPRDRNGNALQYSHLGNPMGRGAWQAMVHTVALMLEWVLSRFSHAEHSLPGSSAHGILQARVLEWVAIPFSRGSSWWRDQTWVFCAAGGFFTTEPLGKPYRGMISPHNNGHVTDHRYHLLHIKNLGYRWDDLGEWHWNMYNIIWETSLQSRFDAR